MSIWSLESNSPVTPEYATLPCPDIEPKILCQCDHTGDVTQLQVRITYLANYVGQNIYPTNILESSFILKCLLRTKNIYLV